MNRISNDLHELVEMKDESSGEEGFVISQLIGDPATQQEFNPRLLPISEKVQNLHHGSFWRLLRSGRSR